MTTMSKTISTLRQKLAGATQTLQSEVAGLRTQIAAKTKELSTAQGAPYPPDELAARMRAWLHAHLDHLHREYGRLVPNTMGPQEQTPRAPGGREELLLVLLMRESLDAAIPGFIARLGDYGWGPPSAERPALIEKLSRELSELKQAEENVVDSAAAAGVMIAHREEVVQARAARARTREREEQAARDRAAREEAINLQYQEQRMRGRSVASSYLTRERER